VSRSGTHIPVALFAHLGTSAFAQGLDVLRAMAISDDLCVRVIIGLRALKAELPVSALSGGKVHVANEDANFCALHTGIDRIRTYLGVGLC